MHTCRVQGFVFVVGDALWISAVGFQFVEALNLDYLPQLTEWEARGHYGQKPRQGGFYNCELC